jgi:hypothetical protein
MKPKTKTKAASRLFDIVVEEVSLVDRAANNRQFLLVKRSDMTMLNDDGHLDPIELEPEEDEEVEDPEDDEAEESEGEEKKAPAGDDRADKPADALAPLVGILTDISTKLDALKAAPKTDEETGKPKPKPAEPTDDKLKPRPKPGGGADPKLSKVLEQLGEAVTKVVDLVKTQGQRLARLEKNVQARASVEETSRDAEDNDWPLDINRPLTASRRDRREREARA